MNVIGCQHCEPQLAESWVGRHRFLRGSLTPLGADFLRMFGPWWEPYQVGHLPLIDTGDWQIRRLPKLDGWSLSGMVPELAVLLGRGLPPGVEVTTLHHKDDLWMSDSPAEIMDHLEFIEKAHGNVLVNGLGLGVVLHALSNKPCVESITVIEHDGSLIEIMEPLHEAGWVTIVEADAFYYAEHNNESYDVVWHDIWLDISDTNLPEMDRLEAAYKGRCEWQGSWLREMCELTKDAIEWDKNNKEAEQA